MEYAAIFAAAVFILAVLLFVSRMRRRKQAERAAMKCLTLTDASGRVC